MRSTPVIVDRKQEVRVEATGYVLGHSPVLPMRDHTRSVLDLFEVVSSFQNKHSHTSSLYLRKSSVTA